MAAHPGWPRIRMPEHRDLSFRERPAMNFHLSFRTLIAVTLVLAVCSADLQVHLAHAAPASTPIDMTVSEGTSMSVAVSPDRRTLALDLQGSIWTVPAGGGEAKRI